MELEQIFHVKEGRGESSYAQNSTIQKKIMSFGYSMIRESLEDFLDEDVPESISIADLGCSSGSNALTLISDIVKIVYAKTSKMGITMPEMRVSLSDLPSNDFNNIFISLPKFYEKLEEDTLNHLDGCYISGVPGSFYSRLFPRKSMHFIHSSSSLHWLSQVPHTTLNKGKVYISKGSPISVVNAFRSQFENDFFSFLRKRSEEVVLGGRMVLSFLGRASDDPTADDSCNLWDLLAQSLIIMASEGILKEERIDSFNLPIYAPSSDEVKNLIEQECSFIIDNGIKGFKIEWKETAKEEASQSFGLPIANSLRAVTESMIATHFGNEIVDEIFLRFAQLVDDYYFVNATPHFIILQMSLTRK